MITVTSADLSIWIAAYLWPLTRILSFFAAAPLLGSTSIPASVKVALGCMLAIIIVPSLPPPAAGTDPLTLAGVVVLAHQMLIGLAMGFSMRLVFAAVELAGEMVGLSMGLGFATFFDPQSQGRTSAVAQLMSLTALALFLSTDCHHLMIAALHDSFVTLPAGANLGAGATLAPVRWAGNVFAIGLRLSLPIVGVLLITNLTLAVLSRAAPQLNLFGIGFAVSLGVGLAMVAVALPYLAAPLSALFQTALGDLAAVATPAR